MRGLPQSYEFLIDHSDIYFLNLKNKKLKDRLKIFSKNQNKDLEVYTVYDNDKGIAELHSD